MRTAFSHVTEHSYGTERLLVIEALVIEINTTNLQDMGVDFTASKNHASGSFQPKGSTRVGAFTFSRDAFTDFTSFRRRWRH